MGTDSFRRQRQFDGRQTEEKTKKNDFLFRTFLTTTKKKNGDRLSSKINGRVCAKRKERERENPKKEK